MKKELAFAITVLAVLTGCGKSLQNDVVGKWSYEVSMPIEDQDSSGQIIAKCISEYFGNKSVTHDCELKVAVDSKADKLKIEGAGRMRASGEWSVKDKTLYDKTIDAKAEMSEVKINGEAITDKSVIEGMKKAFDDVFLKGETTSSVTRSFDGKTWVFDQEVDKKMITVTATRK